MQQHFQEAVYLFALNSIRDIGPVRQISLIQHFGSAQAVFQASRQALSALPGLNSTHIQNILNFSQFQESAVKLKHIEKSGSKFVSFQEKLYPQRLLQMASFPALLFYRGDITVLQEKKILAVVGTRKITAYGARVIADFMQPLVKEGVVIVSGLAFGVDALSHRECLKHQGKTVAVQAQGVDQAYPRSHQNLFQDILKNQGCVLSEFPFFEADVAGDTKYLFPRRNRLISGVSDAVLVVEAPEKSGALITAYYALEQNREVMAIPGSVYQKMSQGCLKLIQQGAKAVLSPDDILNEMGFGLSDNSHSLKNPFVQKLPADIFESPLEKQIYDLCFENNPSLDDLIEGVSEPASYVSAAVTKLQLLGRLEAIEGKRFRAI